MFLSKTYCFAHEAEARDHFSEMLLPQSVEDQQFFDQILSIIFSVRRTLIEQIQRSAQRPAHGGLPDECITANEDYVLPALSAQGIGCCLEIRQYASTEVAAGQPLTHAYVVVEAGGIEWVIDVNADPFYATNSGVILAPEKTDLYQAGFLVHRRWVTNQGQLARYECYTREGRTYLTGEGTSSVSMRFYFFESGENQCPILLSPYAMLTFSYSAGWIAGNRRDWIKLVLIAHSQTRQRLLWNLVFDEVSTIEIRFTEEKSLHLVFLDQTELHLALDHHGYPLENEGVHYQKRTEPLHAVVSSFRSTPKSRLLLPLPFEDEEDAFIEEC